jgi:methyl-accepting chemotaxis protein
MRGAGNSEMWREWVGKAADVCERAATGDLEPRLLCAPAEGDLGRLLQSINHLLDMTDAFVRESGACMDAAAKGRYFRHIITRGMRGSFVEAARLANSACAEMAQQAAHLRQMDEKRSTLAAELGQAISAISQSAGDLRSTAEALASGAQSTTDVSSVVSAAAVETSASVETVASAAEELTASFSEVERQTRASAGLASSAMENANRTSAKMQELSEASRRIGGVVKLITQIAAQTKLLALNAAIEAACSGEAGRGFAVVAAEVKELAQRTSESTEDIADEIQRVQNSTREVADGMGAIGERIRVTNEICGSITQAISEQRCATKEISQNANRAASHTQSVSRQIAELHETAQLTREHGMVLLQAAGELARQSQHLETALRGLMDVSLASR